MISSAEKLRSLLFQFASESEPDPDLFAVELRRALLDFGSETEDNLSAVSRIDVGEMRGDFSGSFGMRVAKSGDSLTAVLNHFEGERIPEAVRQAFPGLDEEDFDAVIRIAVLCLSAFERNCNGRIEDGDCLPDSASD